MNVRVQYIFTVPRSIANDKFGSTKVIRVKYSGILLLLLSTDSYLPFNVFAIHLPPLRDRPEDIRAILAASVHVGHYQAALMDFAEAERDWLNAHRALFLSVSLALSTWQNY